MGNKQSKRDATARQQRHEDTETETETEEEEAVRKTEEAAQREALYNAPSRLCALPETTAWAIATAHCEQLRGLLRLTTDASVSDPLALVLSYEWVHIEVLNSDHAAQARVVTIAWLWLSCCVGYGGDENPRFWKRVFDELQRRGPHHTTPQANPSITDAIRFFGHADRAFPRIRLETTDFAHARVFMGITEAYPPTPAAQHDARQLAEIYEQLQPFLIASRLLQRTVDVAIQSHDIEQILKRDDHLPVALAGQPDALFQQLRQAVGTGPTAVESVVQAIVQSLTMPLPFSPVARVHPEAMLVPPVALAFHSLYMPSWSIHPTERLRNACLWIPSTILQIDELICESRSWGDAVFVETGDLATLQLRSLFGLERPHANVPTNAITTLNSVANRSSSRERRLVLQRQTLSRSLFAAVCSALPHAQSISSLCVAAPPPLKRGKGPIHRAPFRVFDAMNWAWLGYAIFHPDATEQTCTWRDLDLFADDLTPRAAGILELMALGNNLATVEATFASKPHALPSLAPPHSTHYHLARLHTNTQIRRYPSHHATVLYHYVEAPSQCERFSVDNSTVTRDDWVRVVLPGAGFGWVLATAVVDIVSRTPRGSSAARLRGLRLGSTSLLSPSRAALEFVLLVGSGLTRLHADACGELPPDKLLQLLLACPSLTTLSVIHNGSLWGDPRKVEHLRQLSLKRGISSLTLTELSLTLPAGKLVYFPESRSALHRLQALRVVTRSDCFLRNRRALVAFLTAYASLASVYWWDPKPRHRHSDYLSNRIHTHRLMGQLPHDAAPSPSSAGSRGSGSAGAVELCLRCRLAVVQAVAAAQRATTSSSSSALGRLDQDVLALIFAFAPRCGLRDLWIGA